MPGIEFTKWKYSDFSKRVECWVSWYEVRHLVSKTVQEFSKMSPGVYTDSIQNIYIEASDCLFEVEDFLKNNFELSDNFELYVIDPEDPENINWAETYEEAKYDHLVEDAKPEPPPCLADLVKVVEYYDLKKDRGKPMSDLYFFTRKMLET